VLLFELATYSYLRDEDQESILATNGDPDLSKCPAFQAVHEVLEVYDQPMDYPQLMKMESGPS